MGEEKKLIMMWLRSWGWYAVFLDRCHDGFLTPWLLPCIMYHHDTQVVGMRVAAQQAAQGGDGGGGRGRRCKQ